ncbi:hypothetical protein AGMMS49974_07560 [Deltaproteobacteria bacterium]|nr:hypothetical protein AGMMS49974_07560 [Deltaproteobacteria bacterium]
MNSLLRCCLGALPLLMLCTAACSGGDSRDKAPPAAPVHAEPVKRADMSACCTLSATSGHPATVGVKPEVHFTEGQDVTEGQLLITLTPDPLRLFCAKNAACWPNLKRS